MSSPISCPSCNVLMEQQSLSGTEFDRCSRCEGIWCDASELRELLEVIPASLARSRDNGDGGEDLPSEDCKRDCPRCGRRMDLLEFAGDSGVIINRCDECPGVWLERGQLERIIRYRSGDEQEMATAQLLADRVSDRRGVVSVWLRSRLLSGVVAALYLALSIGTSGMGGLWIACYLLLPLACIWFPEDLGSLTGISFGLARPRITKASPADFVAFGGWLLLLIPIVMGIWRAVASS